MKDGDPRLLRQVERFREDEQTGDREPQQTGNRDAVPSREPQADETMSDGDADDEQNDEDDNMVMALTDDKEVRDKLRDMNKQMRTIINDKQWDEEIKAMETALQREGIGNAISEIYSPTRVNGIAAMAGIMPGMSMDLTTNDPDDGKPWDFTCKKKRDQALDKILGNECLLLVGSPMCKSFSRLQQMNYKKMDPGKRTSIINEGLQHLRFCFLLYKIQWEQGRYFLHEHPATATSWQQDFVRELCECEGVNKYDSDMCCFGMHQAGEEGMEFVKKPTTFLTNADEIGKALSEKCMGTHKHIRLLNGRASRAERCRSI